MKYIMNKYTFEEIAIGQTESFKAKITEEMMDSFLKTTGDSNPMHLDSEFASENGYRDRIVYGMLTASFLSTLAGVYLPGKYCIIYGVDLIFHKPVYVGDELTICGQVIEKEDSIHKRINVKAIIKNADGVTVTRAKLLLGLTK